MEMLTSLKQFYFPKIPCSVPNLFHPKHCEVESRVNEWGLSSMKVKSKARQEDLVQQRLPMIWNMTVPFASDMAAIVAGAKYMWGIFFLDDPADKLGILEEEALDWASTVMEVMAGKRSVEECDEQLTLYVLSNMFLEIRGVMHPRQYERFVEAHKTWKVAVVASARSYATQSPPDIDTYIKWRRGAFLAPPCFVLLERCLEIELGDADHIDPDLQAMHDAINDHMIIIHDLFSFRKDFYAGDFGSLPSLLCIHDHRITSFQQAINQLCDALQVKEREFFVLRNQLCEKAAKDNNLALFKYLMYLPFMFSANMRFHASSSRYHGMNNPLLSKGMFHGTMILDPCKTIIVPKDISY